LLCTTIRKAGLTARLYHGDALQLQSRIDELFRPDALISDPPWGMNLNTNNKRFSGGEFGHRNLGDGRDYGEAIIGDDEEFDPSPWLGYKSVVLFGYNHFAARLPVGTTLVWIKRNEPAYGSFLSDAELAWMKGGHGAYCRKDLSNNSISRSRVHPTQKPVSLMEWVIEKAKVPVGATVFDPFMGSGSTALACLRTGRNFVGCELDENYYEAAVQRVQIEQVQLRLF
jgi:hypothetical protein